MIVAYTFVTILCGAFAFPFPLYNTDESDLKFGSKKTTKDVDFFKPDYEADISLEESVNSDELKRRMDDRNWRNMFIPQKVFTSLYSPDISVEDNSAGQNADDYLLHLSANKDLIKFLEWTMTHLGSLQNYNSSGNYYPGLNMWKKLNLSGRREVPLYVEEPKYIVVRREPDDLEPQLKSMPDIPFIPPRGRKYIPNLEGLMTRNDLFFPNRGKRDRLKDIFKYDDLFFPNRGRKRSNYESNNPTMSPTNNGYATNDRTKPHKPLLNDYNNVAVRASATDRVGNINGLVSTSTLHLPPLLQIAAPILAADDDGHQDAVGCTATVAQCQKPDDVKINGFDQSVKAQIHQRHREDRDRARYVKAGAALSDADSQRDARRRRPLLSSLSTSVEAPASSFLPLIQPDQVRRLQPHPIRNKQWRDYY